jgi:CDP-diacylglycerol--serine O-phosphatidyltransferase
VKLFDSFSPRYLVPNGVTCLSMVLGLASIRSSLLDGTPAALDSAAWLILWAVLLDKVDGFLARRLQATSSIGVQLDSFSDFVTFGLAPAALFSRALPTLAPSLARGAGAQLVIPMAGAYAVATALRLAKFNVTTAGDDPRFFRGLPSTSSGGLLASAFLAHRSLGLGEGAAIGLLAWMGLNTALMLSNLPQPKLGTAKAKITKALQLVVVVLAYTLIPLRKAPVVIMCIATFVSLLGFAIGITAKRREAREGGQPGPASDPEHHDHDADVATAGLSK